MIDFTVIGKPEPGGSKKGFYINGHVVIADANKNVKSWKKQVERVAFEVMCKTAEVGQDYEILEGPLQVEFRFGLRRPKSHYGKNGLNKAGQAKPHPTSAPDTTKLVRAVEDACTGIVWKDDAQIVRQTASKMYVPHTGEPFARVIVHAL